VRCRRKQEQHALSFGIARGAVIRFCANRIDALPECMPPIAAACGVGIRFESRAHELGCVPRIVERGRSDDDAQTSVDVRQRSDFDSARIDDAGVPFTSVRRDRGERSERAAGSAGKPIVAPGFRERGSALVRRCNRLARLPQMQLNALFDASRKSRQVDHNAIDETVDPCTQRDAAAALFEHAVVEVDATAETAIRDKWLQVGKNDLAGRTPIRQRVGTIELQRQAVGRPEGRAEATVAEPHRLHR
jgi:hypothetical protein